MSAYSSFEKVVFDNGHEITKPSQITLRRTDTGLERVDGAGKGHPVIESDKGFTFKRRAQEIQARRLGAVTVLEESVDDGTVYHLVPSRAIEQTK
jgi:hypothetical protein